MEFLTELADIIDNEEEHILADASFREELYIQSIEIVAILVLVERVTGIKLYDETEELEGIECYSDLIAALGRRGASFD